MGPKEVEILDGIASGMAIPGRQAHSARLPATPPAPVDHIVVSDVRIGATTALGPDGRITYTASAVHSCMPGDLTSIAAIGGGRLAYQVDLGSEKGRFEAAIETILEHDRATTGRVFAVLAQAVGEDVFLSIRPRLRLSATWQPTDDDASPTYALMALWGGDDDDELIAWNLEPREVALVHVGSSTSSVSAEVQEQLWAASLSPQIRGILGDLHVRLFPFAPTLPDLTVDLGGRGRFA